jgi:DNA-binding MarR family transcriptional regulator
MAGRSSRQSSAVNRQSRATSQEPRAANHEARPAKHEATNLDRVIHERMRLAIVSALAVNDSLTFNDLKRLLDTTDGNLSVHARKLEDARYIVCEKSFEGRMPKTEFRLTAAGRKAFEKYVAHMEALIRNVKN